MFHLFLPPKTESPAGHGQSNNLDLSEITLLQSNCSAALRRLQLELYYFYVQYEMMDAAKIIKYEKNCLFVMSAESCALDVTVLHRDTLAVHYP